MEKKQNVVLDLLSSIAKALTGTLTEEEAKELGVKFRDDFKTVEKTAEEINGGKRIISTLARAVMGKLDSEEQKEMGVNLNKYLLVDEEKKSLEESLEEVSKMDRKAINDAFNKSGPNKLYELLKEQEDIAYKMKNELCEKERICLEGKYFSNEILIEQVKKNLGIDDVELSYYYKSKGKKINNDLNVVIEDPVIKEIQKQVNYNHVDDDCENVIDDVEQAYFIKAQEKGRSK